MEYINLTVLVMFTVPWIALLLLGLVIVTNHTVSVGGVVAWAIIAAIPIANILFFVAASINYFDLDPDLEVKATVPRWLIK